ncbi:MAG: zinc-dependent peptidase, partial [Ekhidna sp.]|nr:zinc-dependent peptidase [Ekhidna sp.]
MILTLALIGLLLLFLYWKSRRKTSMVKAVPEKWKEILQKKVLFYKQLDESGRARFERDVQQVLGSIRISGVKTEVDITDRLLVASSAVIPLFGFPAWGYNHLDEVLLYPSSFDRNFQMGSTEEIITGMVGSGAMEGKMILS